MKTNKLFTNYRLLMLLLIVSISISASVTAAEKLMIPLGKSISIPSNGVKKILAVKEGVVHILNVSDSEIIISGIGEEPSATQLILWDATGRRLYDVETYSENNIIQQKFTAIIGNSNISLVLFPDSAYLKGQVSSENEKIQAEKVARSLILNRKLVSLIEQETNVPSLQQRIEQAIKIPTVKVSVLSADPDFGSPTKTKKNASGTATAPVFKIVLEGKVQNQNDYIHLVEIVKGFVTDAAQISNLVIIDKPVQVVFQAYILQVSKNNTKDLGIEWGKSGTDGGIVSGVLGFVENSSNAFRGAVQSVGAPVPNNLNPFAMNNINRFDLISAQVKAWETQGKAKVLANPKLMVYANSSPLKIGKAGWFDEKFDAELEETVETDTGLAYVNVGQDIYYPAKVDTSGNITYEKAEATLKLMVRDLYVKDAELKFSVFAKQAEPSFTRGINAPPDILKRSLMTTVKIKDQQTIVLGGLINRSKETSWKGVPLLSRLPLVGRLFKSRTVNNRENELVIILTPEIVKEETDLSGDKRFKTVPVPKRSDKLEKLHKMFQQIKSSHLPVSK